MVFLATISAIVTGLTTPANTLIFGRLIDVSLSFDCDHIKGH